MARKKTAKVKRPSRKRGYKTCPQCSKQVGARTRKCECGYEFQTKIRRVKEPLAYEDQLKGFCDSIRDRLDRIDETIKELEDEKAIAEKRLKGLTRILGNV